MLWQIYLITSFIKNYNYQNHQLQTENEVLLLGTYEIFKQNHQILN